MEKRTIVHVSSTAVSGRMWLSLTQPALLSHRWIVSAFCGLFDVDALQSDLA